MPIKESAKKELRKTAKRYILNRQRQKTMKDLIKKARKLSASGKTDEVKKIIPEVCQAIDKTRRHGLIKKNNASRKKSQTMKLINKGYQTQS